MIGFSFGVQAQLEGSKKIKLSITPPKEKTPKISPLKKTAIPKTEQVIKYEPEFFKPKSSLNYVSTVPKVGEIEKKTYEVKSAQELFETQNQQQESSVGFAYDSDTFLGEYIVYTNTVTIKYRDYGNVDGDNIRIILNGQIVKDYVTLKGDFDSFALDLNEGGNIVQIQALNTGIYFPNTGNFVFYDGNSKLVVNQNWGLTAGYKAIVKITRKKGINEMDEKK
jgi:hypothetical protein